MSKWDRGGDSGIVLSARLDGRNRKGSRISMRAW